MNRNIIQNTVTTAQRYKQHHIMNTYHNHCLCGLIYNFASSSAYLIFTEFETVYKVTSFAKGVRDCPYFGLFKGK